MRSIAAEEEAAEKIADKIRPRASANERYIFYHYADLVVVNLKYAGQDHVSACFEFPTKLLCASDAEVDAYVRQRKAQVYALEES